jgi:formimidoylglutamate deiminase
VQDFLRLLEGLAAGEDESLRVGLALHSLRAVPPEAMRELLAADITRQRPIHIHVAEQVLEVEDCLTLRGARPVQWLLDNADVGADWTLVHATHVDAAEVEAMAASKAVVAICPTTEANLGDGLFPLRSFLDRGGRIGIGSDSNVSVSPVEELRWLEYGQRLHLRERNVIADHDWPSSGESLVRRAVAGGRQSNGQGAQEGDYLMLDADAPLLQGVTAADLQDRFVFAGNRNLIREVYVGGRRVVADGKHPQREAIALRYKSALAALLAVD